LTKLNRRLYVSHATKVVVIDLDKEEVAGEIADTPGVHGLAPAPDLQRGVTSNGRENKASIVDLQTLATLSVPVVTGRSRLPMKMRQTASPWCKRSPPNAARKPWLSIRRHTGFIWPQPNSRPSQSRRRARRDNVQR
jgi:hypothetical protein